jgi:hypothetical protein
MGVEFIAKKENKFKHRRDAKFAEKIQAGNLLSGGGVEEKTTHQFRCKAEGDITPEVGMRVLLYQEGMKINVLYQNQNIGVVMSLDAAALKTLWEKMGAEISAASIVNVRLAAEIFLIQLL